MITVEKLCKSYGAVRALDNISFSVDRGEIVGLLGPNGAGKTTLLKILTGYFEPSEGDVRIANQDVIAKPKAAQAHIGYLPENAPLYPEMLVQESLYMISELRGIPSPKIPEKLDACIHATGLEKVLTKPIYSLSKGYRQRVGLAQAIVHEPDILILDEPTNGLDPDQIVEVRHLIQELSQQTTVIVSTHILSEVEQTCKRVLILMEGKLKADANLQQLTQTNRYKLILEEGVNVESVKHDLQTQNGVDHVMVDKLPDSKRPCFIVEGAGEYDYGKIIYEQAVAHSWPVRELRQDTRTLESVFRSLSTGQEVQL